MKTLVTENAQAKTVTESDVMNRKCVRDITKVCECACAVDSARPEPHRLNREAWQPCEYCGDYESLPEHIVDDKVVGKVFDACIGEDQNGWHIELPHDPDIGIQYCPVCGRPLTDAAWKQLEERLM